MSSGCGDDIAPGEDLDAERARSTPAATGRGTAAKRRQAIVWSALASVALAPALVEQQARVRLAERLARCPDGRTACGGVRSIELDATGVRLDDVWVHRRGWLVGAAQVRFHPDGSGLRVDVEHPWIVRAPTTSDEGETARPRDDAPPKRRAASELPDLQVVVASRGALVLPPTPAGTITVLDPVLTWRPGAPLDVRTQGSLEHPWGRIETVGPLRLRVDPDRRDVALRGALSIGGAQPTTVAGTLGDGRLVIEVDDGAGGRLDVRLDSGSQRADLTAHAFGLGRLGTFGPPALDRVGLELDDATLDGAIEIDRTPGQGVRAHVGGTTVRGLRIAHARLASTPVQLEALTLAGDLSWQARQLQAQLTLAHRGAQLHVGATRTSEALTLDAEIPRASCQTLFDAIPEAITGVTTGMRWSGDIDGRVSFQLEFEALATARADPETVAVTPPGRLDLAFAPFERCTVLADAPPIDLEALRGPYRHRFVDDRGRSHERVMATGAPGYVPLSSIPLVARAFSMLEDTRYFKHDGFDRGQLERALWYNLAVGRVARGASTITQQTARSLWLGLDRTLARKLQEAILASRLEHALDKQRILELYLNVIELGPGVHGVAEAAQFHFGKPPQALDPAEALHLASLAPAPRALTERFARTGVDEAWRAELHHHIRRMHLWGHIGHEELLQSLRNPLHLTYTHE